MRSPRPTIAALMVLGSVLTCAVLQGCGSPPPEREWFEGGDRLWGASVADWMTGSAAEQLAVSAVFLSAAKRADADYVPVGPGFMRDAAVLRYCIDEALQVEGAVSPDTPWADIAALCMVALTADSALVGGM